MTTEASEKSSSTMPLFFVLQSGLITSVLALAGVYWLNTHTTDFNIMGWYANYVIPAGAVIVGFVAGAGYGLASWWTGVRIGRWLLVAVLLLQAGTYVAAEYVEYRDVIKQMKAEGLVMNETGRLPTFFEYYDFKARSFAFKSKHSTEEPKPMGAGGYFFMALGAIGFIAGGALAPAILFAVPYCSNCQRYMKTSRIGVIPASVPVRKVSKKDPAAVAAFEAENQAAAQQCEANLQSMRAAIEAGSADDLAGVIQASGSGKVNNKLPARTELVVCHCRGCRTGYFEPVFVVGQGNAIRRQKLEQTPVAESLVAGLAERKLL